MQNQLLRVKITKSCIINKSKKTKLISLHQNVSTEATLLIRNSVEIDNKAIQAENMRQSGNKFSR